MHQKITITQPWASSTTAQIWWTPKISLCSFFALQYMLVLDVNVFLLEKWQYVTKMLLFYCRTEIPKLDLDSARVPVSQLFKKTALVKIKAAESLRRFVNLTSFKSVWQQSWDLLVVVQLLALSSETHFAKKILQAAENQRGLNVGQIQVNFLLGCSHHGFSRWSCTWSFNLPS